MIVRALPGELLLITQPDHAALAMDILERWIPPDRLSDDWRSTLLYATRHHDNGWLDADPLPTVNRDGRPHDFLGAPDELRLAVWPRAVARLGAYRPLVGALVAQHALTIYARYENDPGWSGFFGPLAAQRDRWLVAAGRHGGSHREAFDRAYGFLHMADLASLVFCNHWTDPQEDRGHRFILKGDTLMIVPDPFAGQTVDLRVRARAIPDCRYESDDDLRRALRTAPERWMTGIASSCP